MDFPKVIVITATTGNPHLTKCLLSVQAQTYPNIEHLLVCDGQQFEAKVDAILAGVAGVGGVTITKMVIPWNSGANRYICHKIYASIPHLIHEPCYISFLDEDNYVEPHHIQSMMDTIQTKKCVWTYCLRNIIQPTGKFICRDLCESLGKIHSIFNSSEHSPSYHVDTSCYLIPVEIVRRFSECWQRPARAQPEGDRCFYDNLSRNVKQFECTMKFTLNYRVEGREDSVKPDFFLMGNGILKNRMNVERLPWDDAI